MAIENRDSNRRNNQQTVAATWTGREAYLLAAICLLAGMALGYLFHGTASPVASPASASAPVTTTAPLQMPGEATSDASLTEAAAAPLRARVKENPRDFDALVKLGDLYMDHQQYPAAIENYAKALEIDPKNVNVRTDMGTCYFYNGDAQRALAEFQKSLKIDPTHAQTLFNLGIVEQQGLKDNKAAVAAWQKLLATNPTYSQRAKVEQLIAQARQ